MNSQGVYDTGYANLLSVLRDSNPSLPYETIYAGISHYLAAYPISTSLAASVIASPLWQRPTRTQLLSLGNALSNATRIKMSSLTKRNQGIFESSVSSEFSRWIRSVLSGMEGGKPPLIASASLGLLEGIYHSQRPEKQSARLINDVQEVVLLSLVEALEMEEPQSRWEQEFSKQSHATPGKSTEPILAVLARYQMHMNSETLQKLDLFSLAGRLLEAVQESFISGVFDRTTSLTESAPFNFIPANDPASKQLKEKLEDVAFNSKLLARAVAIVGDDASTSSKRKGVWELLTKLACALHGLCAKYDRDWFSEPLTKFGVNHGDVNKQLWDFLKALLFSTLMIQQSMLNVILFLPPVTSSAELQASTLTGTILKTLFTLSTVIDAFGGISSAGKDAKSFQELKKVFYTAVDITAVDERESEGIVRELIMGLQSVKASITASGRYAKAKRAFVLTCAEQFIAVLNSETLENYVVPLCEPHLADPSTRETFEASHSVMLSIFATYADKASNAAWSDPTGKHSRSSDLVLKLVPGYCQYLLKSAQEGGLTTPQLRLAYAALVRGTSAHSNRGDRQSAHPTIENHTASQSHAAGAKLMSESEALTWLCIDLLLSHSASTACFSNGEGKEKSVQQTLRLTLISLLPCVNVELLPKLLQAVEESILKSTGKERNELLQAIYEEMLERVGDRERETTMKWWFALRRLLDEENGPNAGSETSHYGEKEKQIHSRL